MTAEDTLTVRFTDSLGKVLEKTYSSADVDSIDKQVGVVLSDTETAAMALGRGIITAYMNELCVLPPKTIYIKEAL